MDNPIPCENCITLAICRSLFMSAYNNEGKITYHDNYQCEGILYRRCKILSSYLKPPHNEYRNNYITTIILRGRKFRTYMHSL